MDALPNGPVGHPTVRVFLAGAVPEVMLHLRKLGLLDLDCLTVAGERLGSVLDWWEKSDRRQAMRNLLCREDAVDPDEVIFSPEAARSRGLTSTVTFPRTSNLAPEGSVIKSTAIDPSVVDADGVYRKTGPARVFTSEKAAIAAIKSNGPGRLKAGDVLVLICRGPMGRGNGRNLPDHFRPWPPELGQARRRSDRRTLFRCFYWCLCGARRTRGVGRRSDWQVLDGDTIRLIVDRNRLEGSVDLIGEAGRRSRH